MNKNVQRKEIVFIFEGKNIKISLYNQDNENKFLNELLEKLQSNEKNLIYSFEEIPVPERKNKESKKYEYCYLDLSKVKGIIISKDKEIDPRNNTIIILKGKIIKTRVDPNYLGQIKDALLNGNQKWIYINGVNEEIIINREYFMGISITKHLD
ncbi:MAG: hypothetical protein QXW35_00730 [Candidatus Aenigmatarchaeota archaeon]